MRREPAGGRRCSAAACCWATAPTAKRAAAPSASSTGSPTIARRYAPRASCRVNFRSPSRSPASIGCSATTWRRWWTSPRWPTISASISWCCRTTSRSGRRLDRYPYAAEFPYPPGEPWLEPLTALAAIAGATRRVRLGTGVLIAPLRPVLLLAKTVATLDVLSRGSGRSRDRHRLAARGVRRAGDGVRGPDRTDGRCRARLPRVVGAGAAGLGRVARRSRSPTSGRAPRPVQTRVPIWYGGQLTPPMVERIATLGDGWLPLGPTVPEIAAGIETLRAAFRARGRDPATLGVRVGVPVVADDAGRVDAAATFASAPELAAMGVTSLSVALGRVGPHPCRHRALPP